MQNPKISKTLGKLLALDLGTHESHQKISTSASSILSYQVLPAPEISYSLENSRESLDFADDVSQRNHPKSPIFINIVPEPSSVNLCLNETSLPENLDERERPYVGYSNDPVKRLDVYLVFVKHLGMSDFPFSVEQREVISRIEAQVGILRRFPKEFGSFNQYHCQERKLLTMIDILLKLLAATNYQPVSQIRINRSVLKMINELKSWISDDPAIVLVFSKKVPFLVDPAAYMTSKLLKIFPEADNEKMEVAFFSERKEIHTSLISLFVQSRFPFTVSQRSIIIKATKMVQTTSGDPDSKEEWEFLGTIRELLNDLNHRDQGMRMGISSPKKVSREFNKFVENLLVLGRKERAILNDYDQFSLLSANLVDYVIKVLLCEFIPRYTFPQPRAPNSIHQLLLDYF